MHHYTLMCPLLVSLDWPACIQSLQTVDPVVRAPLYVVGYLCSEDTPVVGHPCSEDTLVVGHLCGEGTPVVRTPL